MKIQELMKNDGSNNTSIGFDLIYFGRVDHLSDLDHRKKIETLRYLIDKEGIEKNIDWKLVDDKTKKKFNIGGKRK